MSPKQSKIMSESEQIKSPQSSYDSTDAIGYYVYCVAESIPAEEMAGDARPGAIEDGADLELIKTDKLTAIVSKVPLSIYGESALSEKLLDAAWTAIRAMRHEHVVEHFARQTSVVPLRFGTIYLNRSGVEQMLSDKQEQLIPTIQRLKDRVEWGVNMFCDRATLLVWILDERRRQSRLVALVSAGAGVGVEAVISLDDVPAEIPACCHPAKGRSRSDYRRC